LSHGLSIYLYDDPSTTDIYTLSLHDALPICAQNHRRPAHGRDERCRRSFWRRKDVSAPSGKKRPGDEKSGGLPDAADGSGEAGRDRKSTRLNSSHQIISYAVFCLKKKNK